MAAAAPACAQVDTSVVLTSEADSVVAGGLNPGTSTLANLDLTAHWQGENGWEAFGYVLGDFGDDFSAHRVGDAQVISNIDSPDGFRLFELYGKKSFGDKASVTAGLINLNGIFDVQDVGSLFLNASHGIGPDYSQIGPSIFPVSSLGVVGEWQVGSHDTLRTGVFDAVSGDANDIHRFVYVRLSGDEGAHLIAELQHDFEGGDLKLGVWHNTGKTDRLDGNGPSHRNSGLYGQLAVTLSQEADTAQGLKAWLRVGGANADLMAFDRYAGGGLVYTGLFPGRDTDQSGLAVAVAHYGRPYQASVGENLHPEVNWEASYRYDVNDRLSFQPDVQYVQHPSGRDDIDDALVFCLRAKISLEGS